MQMLMWLKWLLENSPTTVGLVSLDLYIQYVLTNINLLSKQWSL